VITIVVQSKLAFRDTNRSPGCYLKMYLLSPPSQRLSALSPHDLHTYLLLHPGHSRGTNRLAKSLEAVYTISPSRRSTTWAAMMRFPRVA